MKGGGGAKFTSCALWVRYFTNLEENRKTFHLFQYENLTIHFSSFAISKHIFKRPVLLMQIYLLTSGVSFSKRTGKKYFLLASDLFSSFNWAIMVCYKGGKKQGGGNKEELARCQISQKPNPETKFLGNCSRRGETSPEKGKVRCIESVAL